MLFLFIAILVIVVVASVSSNKNDASKENNQRGTHAKSTKEPKSSSTELANEFQNNIAVDEKWEGQPFVIIPYKEFDNGIDVEGFQKMYACVHTKGTTFTYISVYVDKDAFRIYIPNDKFDSYRETLTKSTVILRETAGTKRIEVSVSGVGNANKLSNYNKQVFDSYDMHKGDETEEEKLTEEGHHRLFENAGNLIKDPRKDETLLSLAYRIIGESPEQSIWRNEWQELIDYALPNKVVDIPDDYEWADALRYSIRDKLNHREQYYVCEALLHYPGELTNLQQCWILELLKWLFYDSNFTYRDDYLATDYEYLCKDTKTKEIFMRCIGEFPGLNASLMVYALCKCDIDNLHELLSAYLLLDQDARIEFSSQMNRALNNAVDLILNHSIAELSAAEEEFAFIDKQRAIKIGTGHPFFQIESCLKQGILTKKTLQEIESGIIWKNEDEMLKENDMWVFFIYPNGKHGDIDMAIAEAHGKEIKIDQGLLYKVLFENKDFKYAELIANQFIYFNQPLRCPELLANNKEFYSLLSKYNNYQCLRELHYGSDGMFSHSSLCSYAGFVYRSAAQDITKKEREEYYLEVVKNGKATSGWKSEQQVYALVSQRYPDAIYQYHTGWLGAQSLDIFIPSLSVGIEYQGQQHYEPVDFFGGIEKFEMQVESDEKKRLLCEKNSVKLVYWKYNEPITVEMLDSKMKTVNN